MPRPYKSILYLKVIPPGWLVDHQDTAPGSQPSGQDEFLLVAAGQSCGQGAHSGRADTEPVDVFLCDLRFFVGLNPVAARQPLQCRQGDVLMHPLCR